MTKLLIGLLGAGVIATGGYAAATSVDADPARTVSLPGATSTGDTTTADTTTAETTTAATTTDDVDDISGPCDEAEHRNDPRCTGVSITPPAPAPAPAPGTTTDDGADISGPCDEAEHANDPRCTGGAAADERGRDDDDRGGDDDNSGHGSGGENNDADDGPLRLEQRQGLVHHTTTIRGETR